MGRNIKWTEELLILEALKYNEKSLFRKYSYGAYCAAKRKKILKQICMHMKNKIKEWTNSQLFLEALKYKTRKQFETESGSAYKICHKRNIIEDACRHMDKRFLWDYMTVKSKALEYETRIDFCNGSPNEYAYASRKNILQDICKHMQHIPGGFKTDKSAIMYYLKINDGIAYKIGITNRTVAQRFSSESAKIEVLNIWEYKIGKDAIIEERRILNEFKDSKWKKDKILKDGNTELFDNDVLGLDI